MKETTVRTCRIFLYSIWSSFAHIPTSGILADGNRELRGSIVILKVPDLLWSNYMPSFKKKIIFLCLVWVFMFLIVTICGEYHIPFTLVNFPISQFVSMAPKKIFWYTPWTPNQPKPIKATQIQAKPSKTSHNDPKQPKLHSHPLSNATPNKHQKRCRIVLNRIKSFSWEYINEIPNCFLGLHFQSQFHYVWSHGLPKDRVWSYQNLSVQNSIQSYIAPSLNHQIITQNSQK